eukprot:1751789-Alexandrium_andersonii.AAC.1
MDNGDNGLSSTAGVGTFKLELPLHFGLMRDVLGRLGTWLEQGRVTQVDVYRLSLAWTMASTTFAR